jgi:hypothetical protein
LEPVIWIAPPPVPAVEPAGLARLARAYQRAGLNYFCVFDRVNSTIAWPFDEWRRPGLPARFAELFAPVAEVIYDNGLYPVVGPLATPGQYWELSFVAQFLTALNRQSEPAWLERLVLGVIDSVGRSFSLAERPGRSTGRPAPYSRSGIGARSAREVTTWYDAIAREHLGRPLPQLGVNGTTARDNSTGGGAPDELPPSFRPASEVIADLRGGALPPHRLAVSLGRLPAAEARTVQIAATPPADPAARLDSAPTQRLPIEHYLLLCPSQSTDAERWSLSGLLAAIAPYVGSFRPTIGFSVEEAALARAVTIVGPDSEMIRQIESKLATDGRQAEAIPSASINELKRLMLDRTARKERFARGPGDQLSLPVSAAGETLG